MFKIQIKPRQKCAARRVAASSSSIIHRLSLRVDPVCLDMEKAQQASERGLSVVRREGKVKRINNAIIVQCQNEILFNEASLKICQKSRAHQSGPVPCREVCVVGWCGYGGKTQSRLSPRSHIHIPHNTPPFAAAFGQGA